MSQLVWLPGMWVRLQVTLHIAKERIGKMDVCWSKSRVLNVHSGWIRNSKRKITNTFSTGNRVKLSRWSKGFWFCWSWGEVEDCKIRRLCFGFLSERNALLKIESIKPWTHDNEKRKKIGAFIIDWFSFWTDEWKSFRKIVENQRRMSRFLFFCKLKVIQSSSWSSEEKASQYQGEIFRPKDRFSLITHSTHSFSCSK